MTNKAGKKPEIVAPAGSFSAGIMALQNGADAVYAGLSSFSARKYALNFTFDQLRRIVEYAHNNGKGIYITLNTVIKEGELQELLELIADLSSISIDGIIVQDLGLLDILHTHFPGIALHASTQLSAYNAEGVMVLRDLGVKRVILARELSFDEIKTIRNLCPGIELEVFIHGALCYSISGLCLASGILLHRSGNRGECAQVCRSWFEAGNERGYFFSCNDLMLKENIDKLVDTGIDAFKIEGRMKSPEYVYHVCRYYRAILSKDMGKELYDNDLTASSLIFSRKPTEGFFNSTKGFRMLNTVFPSHTGIKAGNVEKVDKKGFLLLTCRDIDARDGLLFFRGNSFKEPVRFGIKEMKQNGKRVFTVKKGESVWITYDVLPEAGQAVYQISSGKLRQPEINEKEFPRFQIPSKVILILYDKEVSVSISMQNDEPFSATFPFYAEKGRHEYPVLSRIEEEFLRSGESLFYIPDVRIINKTSYPSGMLFIPPSLIKETRRRIFALIEETCRKRKGTFVHSILNGYESALKGIKGMRGINGYGVIPGRALIKGLKDRIPFFDSTSGNDISSFYLHQGVYYGALAPFIEDTRNLCERLKVLFESHKEKQFVLGLNNISHLFIVKALKDIHNLCFFADFFLYCANRASFCFLFRQIERLLFTYFWIEGENEEYEKLIQLPGISKDTLIETGSSFNPPLFLSRVCFKKHACAGNCTGCSENSESIIRMGKHNFRVIIQNCITYLFMEEKNRNKGKHQSPF